MATRYDPLTYIGDKTYPGYVQEINSTAPVMQQPTVDVKTNVVGATSPLVDIKFGEIKDIPGGLVLRATTDQSDDVWYGHLLGCNLFVASKINYKGEGEYISSGIVSDDSNINEIFTVKLREAITGFYFDSSGQIQDFIKKMVEQEQLKSGLTQTFTQGWQLTTNNDSFVDSTNIGISGPSSMSMNYDKPIVD